MGVVGAVEAVSAAQVVRAAVSRAAYVAVCAMASYFLGSDGAPTTAEVLEERLATFGHAEETAALMGDDHESTVAPHPDGAHGVATRAPTHVAILHDEL